MTDAALALVANELFEETILKDKYKAAVSTRAALKRDVDAVEPELARETQATKAALQGFSRKCTREVSTVEEHLNRLQLRMQALTVGNAERGKILDAYQADTAAAAALWAARFKDGTASYVTLARAAAVAGPLLQMLHSLDAEEVQLEAELQAYEARTQVLLAQKDEVEAAAAAAAASEAAAAAALAEAQEQEATAAQRAGALDEAAAAARAETLTLQEQNTTLLVLNAEQEQALTQHRLQEEQLLAAAQTATTTTLAAVAAHEVVLQELQGEADTLAARARELEGRCTTLEAEQRERDTLVSDLNVKFTTAQEAATEAVDELTSAVRELILGPGIPGVSDSAGAKARARWGELAPPSKKHLLEILTALGIDRDSLGAPARASGRTKQGASGDLFRDYLTLLKRQAADATATAEDNDDDEPAFLPAQWKGVKARFYAARRLYQDCVVKAVSAIAEEAAEATAKANGAATDVEREKAQCDTTQAQINSALEAYLRAYGLATPAAAVPDTLLAGTELEGQPCDLEPATQTVLVKKGTGAGAASAASGADASHGDEGGRDADPDDDDDDLTGALVRADLPPVAPSTFDQIAEALKEQAFNMETPPTRVRLSDLQALATDIEGAAAALTALVDSSLSPIVAATAQAKTDWETGLAQASESAAATEAELLAVAAKVAAAKEAHKKALAALKVRFEDAKSTIYKESAAPVERATSLEDELDAKIAAAASAPAVSAAREAEAVTAAASAAPPRSSTASSKGGPTKKRPRLSTDAVSSPATQPLPPAPVSAPVPTKVIAVSASQPARLPTAPPAADALLTSRESWADMFNEDDGVYIKPTSGEDLTAQLRAAAAARRPSIASAAGAGGRPGGGSGRPSAASAAVPVRAVATSAKSNTAVSAAGTGRGSMGGIAKRIL